MFYSARNLNLTLNNRKIYVSDIQISQQANIIHPYLLGDRVSFNNSAQNATQGNLKITYYLTGEDYLKTHIYSDIYNNEFITGNFCGLTFNSGVLSDYSLECAPNSPVSINANIAFFEPLAGTLASQTPYQQGNIPVLRFSDASINDQNEYSSEINNNIIGLSFNYKANIQPSYCIETGAINDVSTYRILVNEKNINSNVVFDNFDSYFPFTGKNYALVLNFYHPTNTGIQETFSCSGRIYQKTIDGGANKLLRSSIGISQGHINDPPSITNVTPNPAFVSGNRQLTISGKNLLNTYEILIGNDKCTGGTVTNTVITTFFPVDVINETLYVKTTKGTVASPSLQTFTHLPIVVSGYDTETGKVGTMVNISGLNFYRISNVKFNNANALFTTWANTGILAICPDNATVGRIYVISNSRSVTGSGIIFYPEPKITSFTPTTGIWSGQITISGINFSGVTGVFFNNIRSFSFTNTSTTGITATIPLTGSGYTKGYITVLTNKGFTAKSYYKYQPIVPIYDIIPKSGQEGISGAIKALLDTGFLCRYTGIDGLTGFKIKWGDLITEFMLSGFNGKTGTLTGLLTGGNLNGSISLYEPDGVTTYPSYTGSFYQVGPAPVLSEISPKSIALYKNNTLTLKGYNFKDFFGQTWYFQISGEDASTNHDVYNYTIISGSNLYKKALVPNIRITGCDINSTNYPHRTGYYSVKIQNKAGSDFLKSGLYVYPPIDEAALGSPSNAGSGANYYAASLAVDGGGKNSTTYSFFTGFRNHRSGSWICTFRDPPIDVSRILFWQKNVMGANVNDQFSLENKDFRTVYKFNVELYNSSLDLLYSGTTIQTRASSTPSQDGLHEISFLSAPTGKAKQIRFYSSGGISNYGGAPYADYLAFGFNNIEVY